MEEVFAVVSAGTRTTKRDYLHPTIRCSRDPNSCEGGVYHVTEEVIVRKFMREHPIESVEVWQREFILAA